MAVTPQKVQKKLLIRQGDNWFNLAQRYGVSPTQLAQANGDIKRLLPGQNIVIPTANGALKALAAKRTQTTPMSQPPPGIPSDVWRRMQQDPAYQGMGAMARPPAGTNLLGGNIKPVSTSMVYGAPPTPAGRGNGIPDINSLQYGNPPAGIPSDVWRQMQNNPPQGMQQIAQANAATLFKSAPPLLGSAVGMPGGTTSAQARAATQGSKPAPGFNAYGGQGNTPYGPPPPPKASQSPAAQQVLANIAAAKASGKAFQITDQERVAKEWAVLNPGQPVPTFSQGFLQRLSNADNAADYQRILQNWSASAGGVGAKNLVEILNKAYNDPTYPWPKAIMPYELAKYNIDKSVIDQLYVYDPKLGYYVIRTNVQGADPGAGAGTSGGGGAAPTQEAQGFTGSGGMPGRQGGGYSNNQTSQQGMLGLINWRF